MIPTPPPPAPAAVLSAPTLEESWFGACGVNLGARTCAQKVTAVYEAVASGALDGTGRARRLLLCAGHARVLGEQLGLTVP